eukprot:TRINITY_DN32628_c0_g1_i1.p1 TRINITY_DN32628_c0_g1~~TRINITY_DN32628_c0_g1_i1.p1  ORF type:complete len:727 (+),score=244.25 TRINITY_DN32628_c0_g1_i1:123-2183(+)
MVSFEEAVPTEGGFRGLSPALRARGKSRRSTDWQRRSVLVPRSSRHTSAIDPLSGMDDDGAMAALGEEAEKATPHFRAVTQGLLRLRQIWALNKTPAKIQNERLAQIANVVRALVHEEEHIRDEKGRQHAIAELKSEISGHCAALEEDIDSFIDPSLPRMTTLEALHSLKSAVEELQALRQERAAEVRELCKYRREIVAELGDGDLLPTDEDEGIGESAITNVERQIQDLEDRLAQRHALLERLAKEAADLIQQRPLTGDASHCELDAKVMAFMRTKRHRVLGIGAGAVTALVQRRDALRAEMEEREQKLRAIQKRLRLIEDRQALLDLIRAFEASAENPLRLFGTSERTAREARFRRMAYPRLLLLESVLRPALLEWSQLNCGRPFLYKGRDYLQLLDEDLKHRKMPKDRFPPPADMDPTWDDFQYVVESQAFSSGADATSDAQSPSGDWSSGVPKSLKELVWDEEERRLLKLGWHPPPRGTDSRPGRRRPPQQRLRAPSVALPAAKGASQPASRSPSPPRRISPTKIAEETVGTALFHTPVPQLFKGDPNLLLPAPPDTKQRRVKLNRDAIRKVATDHESERARWQRLRDEDSLRSTVESRRKERLESERKRKWEQLRVAKIVETRKALRKKTAKEKSPAPADSAAASGDDEEPISPDVKASVLAVLDSVAARSEQRVPAPPVS